MLRLKYTLTAVLVAVGASLVFQLSPAEATGVTSVSLASNKVTPGFALKFSLHSEANVRQNVNRSEPVPLPEGWMIELTKDENYPSGVWGIYRLLMSHNLTSNASHIYSMEAPNEPGYYQFRLRDLEGNFFASEVFQVTAAPFITLDPPRSFETGDDVVLRIYNAQGELSNINEQQSIDVYTFGNGGPITYANTDGSGSVRISRDGEGRYVFPAARSAGEYYVGFNSSGGVSVHSTSFDVIASDNNNDNDDDEENNRNGDDNDSNDDDEDDLPPVLDPYQDTSTTTSNDVDGLPNRPTTTPRTNPIPNVACQLEIGKAYKARNSSAVYYVVRPHRVDGTFDTQATTCKKRVFRDSRLFFTYFTSWSEVRVDDRISSIENDQIAIMPLGPKYDPKYGALVKVVNDPKVYLLLGGKRYWITSEDTFTRLGYSWNWVEDISEDLLFSYEEGSEIMDRTRHPNFTLIKYRGDNKVYRLEPDPSDTTRTVKRHIENEETFNSLGYRWDRIVTLEESEQYNNGETLRYTRTIRLEAR